MNAEHDCRDLGCKDVTLTRRQRVILLALLDGDQPETAASAAEIENLRWRLT